MADAANPLNDADYDAIVTALQQLDLADEGIRKAQQAGIDVTVQQKAASEQRTKLLNLKRVYFPSRP